MASEMESVSDHEVEALARTYGTTVEKVRAVIAGTGTRSIRRIQEALEQQRGSPGHGAQEEGPE